ncbi:O-acyltransferase WSD1-like [Punica granatum]|uniref:O-acyltransferase WSD1-like n=1 Tax=Punica granatum TaxID=22663 RepID=A0A218WB30_PUNGR|nr:O-acyltransferase WSD1-like [Punica granatum]OWM69743.1 hypothetical protein CDL15_Pgr025592 [Punica granatum]
MGSLADGSDEPLTPAGRLFLQKETNQVVYCALGMKHPIDVEAMKASVKGSIMGKHPRFGSLLVRDRRGVEHWRRTELDIDRHFVVVDEPVTDSGDDEAAVNEYMADLSISSGLSTDKPLWEVHVLRVHYCLVLRVHHSLGDGISLMSMFLALCRKANDPDSLPTIPSAKPRPRDGSFWSMVLRFLQMVWFTIVFAFGIIRRSTWARDPKNPISGGDGVELWPRKLATARFWLKDMKLAKAAVPDATINDVLFGVLSRGLSKYLDEKCPNSMQEGLPITGVAMVNLRKQPGLQEFADMMTKNPGLRWGNRFGFVLLPLYYRKNDDPLEHLRKAKKMLDQRKNSLEAHFSYWIGNLVMSCFGAKAAGVLNRRILCNTTFTISNVVGPQEEIAYAGNPITYIKANSSSLPHALTMHMVSYAGWADLQILVAKDIIPDPELLAKCFEDALLEMTATAAAALKD